MDDFNRLRRLVVLYLDAGRSHRVVNHMPDEPHAWVQELERRMEGKCFVCMTARKGSVELAGGKG